MAENIDININVNAETPKQTVGELRKEFRELQKSIGDTVQGTDEYYSKLKRLAEIKGDIQDLKDDIKGLDPGASFQALQGVAQGLVGGFTAATGAVALFAGENKELEQTLVKVNSAIALLGGFQAFNDGLRQASVLLGLVNPQLLLITAAVAGAATAIAYFSAQTSEANKQYKLLQDIQQETIKGYVKEKVAVEQLLSEAQNENTTKKRKKEIIQELNDISPLYFNGIKTEKDLQDKATEAVTKYVKAIELKARVQAATNKLIEAETPVIERQIKLEQDIARDRKFAGDDQAKAARLIAISQQKAAEDIAKLGEAAAPIRKIISDTNAELEKLGGDPTGTRNKNFQKGLEDAKKNAEARLKIEEEFEKQRQATEDKIRFQQTQLVDPNQLANEAKARVDALSKALGVDKIDPSKIKNPITGLTSEESLNKIQTDFEQQQLLLLEQRANGLINEQTYNDQLLQLQLQSLEQQRQTAILYGNSTLEFDKQIAEAKITLSNREKEAKIANLQAIAGALDQFAAAAGQDTAIGKAFAVASATINTYLGITKALGAYPPPFNYIAAAGVGVAGFSNVKKIVSTKVPGKGDNGGSVPSAGGGIPTTAPTLQPQTAVQTVNTILNPTQAQQLNPANIPAPVVSVTEINRVQNQVRVIEGNNTVGIRRPI